MSAENPDCRNDEEYRQRMAHTAWWGMMICAVGAVVVAILSGVLIYQQIGATP